MHINERSLDGATNGNARDGWLIVMYLTRGLFTTNYRPRLE